MTRRRDVEPCVICRVRGGYVVRARRSRRALSKKPKTYAGALKQLRAYYWRKDHPRARRRRR